ncbi:MAG: hypothetical protein MJE68_26250 [Proteobacteria bacterium]|nr:hypothetical protein [Pseudomonadota bacterium]
MAHTQPPCQTKNNQKKHVFYAVLFLQIRRANQPNIQPNIYSRGGVSLTLWGAKYIVAGMRIYGLFADGIGRAKCLAVCLPVCLALCVDVCMSIGLVIASPAHAQNQPLPQAQSHTANQSLPATPPVNQTEYPRRYVPIPIRKPIPQPCFHPLIDERLTNHCLLAGLDIQTAVGLSQVILVDRRMKFEGYPGLGLDLPPQFSPPIANFTFTPSLTPTVQYSHNINGGNSEDPLRLGILVFTGDPELERKSGILIGGESSLSGRWIHGNGHYINFYGGGGYAHSPQHDIGVSNTWAQICANNHLGRWWHGDACIADSRTWRELTYGIQRQGSLTLAKTFAGRRFPATATQGPRAASHRAGVRLGRTNNKNSYGFKHATLFFDSIHVRHHLPGEEDKGGNSLVTGVSLFYGEKKEGILLTRQRVNVKLGWWAKGKPVSVFASYGEARGARLFGLPRDELSRSISLSYPIHPLVSLSLGYSETDSKIDSFDSSTPSINFRFTPIRF